MPVTEYGLPPGAYERDGKYYRTVLKTGVDEIGEWEMEEEREVLLPIATDDESITQSRERAAAKGLDFYDPRKRSEVGYPPETIGWLDRGRKREAEWSWNLGSGSTQKRRYKNVAPAPKKQRPNMGAVEPEPPVPVGTETNHGNG
jgi:hypothetical protein